MIFVFSLVALFILFALLDSVLCRDWYGIDWWGIVYDIKVSTYPDFQACGLHFDDPRDNIIGRTQTATMEETQKIIDCLEAQKALDFHIWVDPATKDSQDLTHIVRVDTDTGKRDVLD